MLLQYFDLKYYYIIMFELKVNIQAIKKIVKIVMNYCGDRYVNGVFGM